METSLGINYCSCVNNGLVGKHTKLRKYSVKAKSNESEVKRPNHISKNDIIDVHKDKIRNVQTNRHGPKLNVV